MRHNPDTSLQHHKSDIVALDGVYRDNMHEILDYCLNDAEIAKVINGDKNLCIT